jgi:hypothetical protein
MVRERKERMERERDERDGERGKEGGRPDGQVIANRDEHFK